MSDIYEILNTQIKKHLYTVFSDKFFSENAEVWIERSVAKHILLKPELIIINDQIQGFKKIDDKYEKLEKFPIFIELEYQAGETPEEKHILGLDLYAEADINFIEKREDITKLAELYESKVVIEQALPLHKNYPPSLVIYSKLNELLSDGYLSEDYEEGLVSQPELETMLSSYLISFVNCIKLIEDIMYHNKSIESIKYITQVPLKD
jgi:hypothetical protein